MVRVSSVSWSSGSNHDQDRVIPKPSMQLAVGGSTGRRCRLLELLINLEMRSKVTERYGTDMMGQVAWCNADK